MKSTGIIRRIDDLGRIAIPKEIRRQLRIQEGCPLEICTDYDYVVLKKYSPIPDYKDAIKEIKNDMIADEDLPHKMKFIRALDALLIMLNEV